MEAYLTVIISAAALLYSLWAGSRKTTKEDSAETARMMAKLDAIGDDIKDLKKDISDVRQSVQENHDEVLKLKISLDTAWKRIDELMKWKEEMKK